MSLPKLFYYSLNENEMLNIAESSSIEQEIFFFL